MTCKSEYEANKSLTPASKRTPTIGIACPEYKLVWDLNTLSGRIDKLMWESCDEEGNRKEID